MLCAVLPAGPCFPGGPAGVGLEEDHEYEGIVTTHVSAGYPQVFMKKNSKEIDVFRCINRMYCISSSPVRLLCTESTKD